MNLYVKGIIVCILTGLAICSAQTRTYAQRQPVMAAPPLVGDSIKTGKITAVQDTIYWNLSLRPFIAQTRSIDNIVGLYINEFSDKVVPDSFDVAVRLQLNYTNASGTTGTRQDTLRLNYRKDSAYSSKAARLLRNYYAMEVQVLDVSITGAADSLVRRLLILENLMVIDRLFTTNCAAVSSVSASTTTVSTKGELTVSWQAIQFIPSYDLEWTYIDKSALDAGNYHTGGTLDAKLIFRNNASRVSLNANSYQVPLLYDGEGSLFFRVRTVQYAPDGEAIAGTWSSDAGPSGLGRYDFTGHERNLNWQATTSFAEEGKRKSVVQYFDGSLKGRQTVTKDNFSETTVVAETLYDKQGRPAIQVLPSPTLSTIIAYTPLFNRKGDVGMSEYTSAVYDTLLSTSEYCDAGAAPMSTASGSSNYYSPQNPLLGAPQPGIHQYIPDANRYPFAETRYTRDNTGRIDRQGGVGPDFQIGSGHETRYFYGSAEQKELDALFGTEAGEASHYEKNMVRDANGQYSISYVDMHGRTIATALAGDSTSSLFRLPGYNSIMQTDNLLTPTNNIIKGENIQASKSILVPVAGNYEFNYSLSPESLSLNDCKDSVICYDCLYDLTITINDNCNNEQFGGAPKVITLKNFSLFKEDGVTHNLDTTCTAAPGLDTTFTLYLQEGSYDITKVLSVSREGMNYYRDSIFLPHNTCKTFDQLLQDELDSIRQRILCQADSISTNLVTAYKDQMMADLTPEIGQYAKNELSPPCFSIFSTVGSQYQYQTVTGYRDEDGKLDEVSHFNGSDWVMVPPQFLSPDEFIDNFKPSWAEALLPLHPEYRLWQQYEKLKSAYNWEAEFFATETFEEALAKGFLNPTGSTSQPATRFTVSGKTDSLFYDLALISAADAASAKTAIENALFQFMRIEVSEGVYVHHNLWGAATGIVKCKTPSLDCYTSWNQHAFTFNTDSLCKGDLDQAWRIFRAQYLLVREDWIDTYARLKSNTPVSTVQGECLPIFPDRNFITNMPANMPYGGYNGTAADTTTAQQNLDAFLYDNCKAYASKWWNDLAPCGYTLADSAAIISRLIEVAYQGADKNHPFGASTVKPSSTHVDRSFEQVINEYNALHYPGMDPVRCNAFLIPYPRPYEQPGMIVNLPIIAAPDSCSCDRINQLYNQFLPQAATYQTFSNYMWVVQGTRIAESTLDTLRNLCNVNSNCTYLEKPILLPPAFQCGTGDMCIDCDRAQTLYAQFRQKFPAAIPQHEETDSAQQRINRLFANYMNQQLGFSKTAQEYLDFLAQCGSPLGNSPACDSLQELRQGYLQIRQELATGNAAGGYRLTLLSESTREAVNGILETDQKKTENIPMSARYYYGPAELSLANKFYSYISIAATGWEGPSEDAVHYAGIWPMNIDLVTTNSPTVLNRIRNYAYAQQVLSTDFAGATLPSDFSHKYYALVIKASRTYNGFNVFWGSRKAWGGTGGCLPNLAGWYGTHAPLAKYLDDSLCAELTCDYYNFYFVKKLSSFSTYAEYTSRLASTGEYYAIKDIKKVLGFSIDPQLVSLYKASGGTPGATNMTGQLIKVRLLMRNNTVEEAWLNNSNCTNVNLLYTELADSTIYGSDCKAGFAAYYNQHKGTSYSYHQIDSIYQSVCGSPLTVCDSIPASGCDSTGWTVYNPGTNLQINADLYANANNNIAPPAQFFADGQFNSPSAEMASHYVLVNKRDSIHAGTNTLLMQWRVKPGTLADLVNPFIRRGDSVTYVGAEWIRDPADTSWFIGATTLRAQDGLKLSGIGLQSNGHNLKADWVKITNASSGSLLYFDDFILDAGNCSAATGPFLCGKPAMDSALQLNMNPCADTAIWAIQAATYYYEIHQQNLKGEFSNAYMRKCLEAGRLESFTVSHPLTEYHYTLYYYDQAGNLVKTVPPEGVHPGKRQSWYDSVAVARAAGQSLRPAHTLATTYRYNSLNQVVTQHSPDGGFSKFWYDRLGRMVVSQNAQQAIDGNYSYTLYDGLGRISEVGQKKQPTAMTDQLARNASTLAGWLNYTYSSGGSTVIAEQVTLTVYDQRDPLTEAMPPGYVVNGAFQKSYTLRNRVSYTRYYEQLKWTILGKVVTDYDNGSTYSYDIHGNVDTLLHDYRVGIMEQLGNRLKAIAYKYDLASGKVNEVHYQPGMRDQFYHRYEYDAENRLTDVYTVDNKALIGVPAMEEHEARYTYYKHGPLARTVLGQQQVQGIDYAYTLQGWIKGVNGDSLLDTDGKPGSAVARDAYRFSLNYYNGEYRPIGAAVANVFPGHTAYMGDDEGDYRPLYNGNISSMVVGIPQLGETKLYNYGYDQLNRLVSMDSWRGFNAETGSWAGLQKTADYRERISYDPNGNILSYTRNGFGAKQDMDKMSYGYNRDVNGHLVNNRLRHVKDAVGSSEYAEDIDDQADDNYVYDAIGNLIKDNSTQEGINSIKWTVHGKISNIYKSDGTQVSYTYDFDGNRISKTILTEEGTMITWYVRNVHGDAAAIYLSNGNQLNLAEQPIYGDTRLGVWNRNVTVMAYNEKDCYGFFRGKKAFELSNHLKSVLITVGDKRLQTNISGESNICYAANVKTANDYYPYGMAMPGRSTTSEYYRYGFNSMEHSSEVKEGMNSYTTEFRQLDVRLGRWLSPDPKAKNYVDLSAYVAFGNNPIFFNDIRGDSIPTVFYDEKGSQTNEIPKVLQETFNREYGIVLGYANGKLYKAGTIATTATTSQAVIGEWDKVLGKNNSEVGLVFGHNLALGLKPTIKPEFDSPVRMGEYLERAKTAVVDLADFDNNGEISGIGIAGSTDAIAAGGSTILSPSRRIDNLARIAEHEYLCHGVLNLKIENSNILGEAETKINEWRQQMGIPTRNSYGYSNMRKEIPFRTGGDIKVYVERTATQVNGQKVTLSYELTRLEIMKKYISLNDR